MRINKIEQARPDGRACSILFIPYFGCQTCTVLSSLPETMYLLSGDQDMALTPLVCPRYVKTWPPFKASQTCTESSPPLKAAPPPEAMRLPSGDHATAYTELA